MRESIEDLSRSVHDEFEKLSANRSPDSLRARQTSASTNLVSSSKCVHVTESITALTSAIRKELTEMSEDAVESKNSIQVSDSAIQEELFSDKQNGIESVCNTDQCCNITELLAKRKRTYDLISQ